MSHTVRQFIIGRYFGLIAAGLALWVSAYGIVITAAGEMSENAELAGILILALGFGAIMVLSAFASRIYCTYTLNDEGLERKWLSRPFLFFRKDMRVPWKDIASYNIYEDENGYLVTIRLHDRSKMTIVSQSTSEDNFEAFLDKMTRRIDRYNAANAAQGHAIVQTPSFFKTFPARVMAVLTAIMLLGFTIMLIWLRNDTDNQPWGKLALLYALGVPFIYRVFGRRGEK